MPRIPGLRSPYCQINGWVYFGRMLDKIRLNAAGRLPPEYQANLGDARPQLFDARCCGILGVRYADLVPIALKEPSDRAVLAWAQAHGIQRTDTEVAIWSRFMAKIGWRDERSPFLLPRATEFGLQDKPIETFFDLIDFDEERDPLKRRAWEFRPPRCVVLMGVSASGKTTVGQRLAELIAWDFVDGDDLHPPENIRKMASGTPLDDHDRAPWLVAVARRIEESLTRGESLILACSALKQAYRDVIAHNNTAISWVYLKGSRALLEERVRNRHGHFMPPQLLDSQLSTLEEPANALVVDVSGSPDESAEQIRTKLEL